METIVKDTVYENLVNENLVQKFINGRVISNSLARIYKSAINYYEKFNGMPIELLIQEADTEEENKIRSKHRQLKSRLMNFRNWILNYDGLSTNTSLKYFSLVLSFYAHHEIEIPKLPRVTVNKDYHIRYEDITKTHHIHQALEFCKNEKQKAIIYFIATSGTSKNETIHLTVEDFFKATKEYHSDSTIREMIYEMLEYDGEIIPLFSLVRIKTDYPYYTCCSPEASNSIIVHLITKLLNDEEINYTDKLFDMSEDQVSYLFKRINRECGWGKVAYYDFFRTHMLRKRFATEMRNRDLVDALEGRKRESIVESYFIHDPNMIKKEYIKYMDRVRVEYVFEQDREEERKDKETD